MHSDEKRRKNKYLKINSLKINHDGKESKSSSLKLSHAQQSKKGEKIKTLKCFNENQPCTEKKKNGRKIRFF